MPDGRMTMDGVARWVLSAVPPRADSVPYVRHQAALVLQLWGLNQVQSVVELLITELGSNVIRHARTPYSVGLSWTGHQLRGEVTDANALPPRGPKEPDVEGTDGRGLLLVNEVADAWGYDRHHHGKTIWFELKIPSKAGGDT